jgi:serine protease AprX
MNKPSRRLLVVLTIFSIILGGITAPASAAAWQTKVDPWVLQTASEGETEFLVYLTAQADLSGAKALSTKLEKGNYVYQSLTILAERTQKGLISQLDRLGVEYQSYWIANMIWVKGGLSTVQLLAGRADVAHIYANPHVALDAPVEEVSPVSSTQEIEWNINKVNAPQVWALGYTGQSVVIGGQDTGYAWNHPAIKNQYRGWNGTTVDHDYNWFDATAAPSWTPIDPFGHGTHTMGTMVGDDGDANKIGMAPGARWIGCRNMDAGGNGTPETYAACYQWFVAPTRVDGSDPRYDLAPDVINNSWSCPPSEGCTDPNVLLTVVQNLVAAGIVSAHSAGNSGSGGCSTVDTPAAIYEESFTVGATDSTDTIADFSSRGPVTDGGSNRLKPDISAPGMGVRSCIPGGGYSSYSGTSMASPHVAGLVALLISAHPALRGQVDQIETIIQQSALHIPWTGCSSSGVPNNAYGWGRIDALAAVETHRLELEKVASADLVAPGDLITYTLTVTHSLGINPTTNLVLTDTIPVGSTFISAASPYSQSGDTIRWDFSSLDTMGTITTDLVVRVNITSTGTMTNSDYAVQSDQVAAVGGEPVTTQLEKLDILQLDKVAGTVIAFPGGVQVYTLGVKNNHDLLTTTNLVLTDTLPLGSSFLYTTEPYTMTGDVIEWDIPSLPAGQTIYIFLGVRIDPSASGSLTNTDYGVYSDQAAFVGGLPVSTPLGKVFFLPIAIKTP